MVATTVREEYFYDFNVGQGLASTGDHEPVYRFHAEQAYKKKGLHMLVTPCPSIGFKPPSGAETGQLPGAKAKKRKESSLCPFCTGTGNGKYGR